MRTPLVRCGSQPWRFVFRNLSLSGGQKRHRSYLSPPFLLDEYTPRYQLISALDASKKRSEAYAHLRNCNLCPRLCGVNRYEKTGVCLIGAETVKVSTIAPHFGEGDYCRSKDKL